jgi:hypothetical protein
MADNKYGNLYTREDVIDIFKKILDDDILDSDKKAIDAHQGKLSGDMPVMVLLGQDRRALGAVKFYQGNQSPDASQHHLDLIDKTVGDFEVWRTDHSFTMKEPD